MKFGEVDTAAANGHRLAHSVRRGKLVLKKGRALTQSDLEALLDVGVTRLVTAALDPDDVHEDAAADQLARALMGSGLDRNQAVTGRVNLRALTDGVVAFDSDAIRRFNRISEAITIATCPAYTRVSKGQLAATIKVIPFAVTADEVEQAIIALRGQRLSCLPFVARTAVLIQTQLPSLKPSVLAKTVEVTTRRLASLGIELIADTTCEHNHGALTANLKTVEPSDVLIIFGASAIMDRADVIPASVTAAGGTISHFGMPVDPGNLSAVGSLGQAVVIGAPGCARSPTDNGFDWLLQRSAARVPITSHDIQDMGVGGLLKEIAARAMPRDLVDDHPIPPDDHPTPRQQFRIGTIVLAAGSSKRMGAENKLLLTLGDGTVLTETLRYAPNDRVVVLGHEAELVATSIPPGHTSVENPEFRAGMASSVVAGLGAIDTSALDAVLIVQGDMPEVKTSTIETLMAEFDGHSVMVPCHNGARGNPIIIPRNLFPLTAQLTGDRGFGPLIKAYPWLVKEVDVDDPGIIVDVDTPESYAALLARWSKA